MRQLKTTSALCLLVLCIGCTPHKRLSLLLAHHPELQRDSALVLHKDIVLPADSAYIDFSLADLRGIAPDTGSQCQSRPQDNDLTVATPSGATATLSSPRPDHYRLQVRSRTDTLHWHDTVTIPAYTTRVEYRDKIVCRMSSAQSFFFGVGIFALILAVLLIALRVVLRFVRK